MTHLHACVGATDDIFDSSTKPKCVAASRHSLLFRVQLSQSGCLSLLLAISSRVYLFFPPRGQESPPTLRDRLNPHVSLQQRCCFPIPLFAKRPDVALYTTGPLFLLPTPSPPYCTLKVSENDSLWEITAAYSDERLHSQKNSCNAQRCFNALTPGHLKGMVVVSPHCNMSPSRFWATHTTQEKICSTHRNVLNKTLSPLLYI